MGLMIKLPYQECPRYKVCSCNKCLLDPNIEERIRLPGDEKCKVYSTTRHKIGQKHTEVLPYQGFSKKQWKSRERWNNLSVEERDGFTKIATEALNNYKKTQSRV